MTDIIYQEAVNSGIQYHSEASPGPKDNEYLFDEFIKMININRNNI